MKKKMINGKLCWRSSPEGDWVEYSLEEITSRLNEVRMELGRHLQEAS
jgi:hypothetical protein